MPTPRARLATLPAPFAVLVLTLGALALLMWLLVAPGTVHTLLRSFSAGWVPERWGVVIGGTWVRSRDTSWLLPCPGGGRAGVVLRPDERWHLEPELVRDFGIVVLDEREWPLPARGDTALFIGMQADVGPLLPPTPAQPPTRRVRSQSGVQVAWPDTGSAGCARAERMRYRFPEW